MVDIVLSGTSGLNAPLVGPQLSDLAPQIGFQGQFGGFTPNDPGPAPSAQPFGLSGAEDILGRGALTGLDLLSQTQQLGAQRFDAGIGALQQGAQQAQARTGVTLDQLGNIIDPALLRLATAGGQGQAALTAGQQQVGGIIGQGIEGLAPVSEFTAPGQQANQLQAALSGALGPEAQALAFQNFQQDPGTQFLREQGERSILRGAAATGGLGGGNVQRELTQFGQGLALQDLTRRQQQLGELAGRGLGAAGTAAGLQAQLRGQQAGLAGQFAQAQSRIPLDVASQQAALSGQQAGLTSQLGQFAAGIPFEAGAREATARQQQAGLETGLGTAAAGIPLGIAGQIGQLRTRAGEAIAGQIGGTSSALADLATQQGAGISDITGAGAANISNLIQSATAGDVNARLQLGALLANLASQQGSQISGLPIIPGATTNTLQQLGQLASGTGALLEGLQ